MAIAREYANFSAPFSTTAFCKVQLILRSCLSSQGVAGFAPKPNFEQTFSAPTPLLTSQPTTQIFKLIFLQLHSARCNWFGAAKRSWRRGAGFSRQPRISPRSPPCSFFYNCILQAAIDFAEVRWRSCGAGFAPEPNF